MNTDKSGLVLEGGGLQGAFTIGVLDAFMEGNLFFPYAIGVSAGAINGLSYIARQPKRAFHCNILSLKEHAYVGIGHFLKGKGYIDLEWLIRTYPEQTFPLDFRTYSASRERFVMVTSNCLTGEAEYFEEKSDKDRVLDICEASGSLPVMCPVKHLDGIPMTDGGVCDSIPLLHTINEGYIDNVVILTRNKGYRKPQRDFNLPAFLLRKYPEIRRKLILRYKLYNEQLDYVEELESKGKVRVIRPQKRMNVTRTTTDIRKLERLYWEGLEEGRRFIEENRQGHQGWGDKSLL